MQNKEPVDFQILFLNLQLSKAWVVLTTLIIGFLTGYLLKRNNSHRQEPQQIDMEIANQEAIHSPAHTPTLSAEDEEYVR